MTSPATHERPPAPGIGIVLPRGTRKSKTSAKVVGTLLDLAEEVLGEKGAAEYPFQKRFQQIPLLSWLPTADFELMDSRELACWIFNTGDSAAHCDIEDMPHVPMNATIQKSLIWSAVQRVRVDPIAFSRQGVYIANWTGDHTRWREALSGAVATRRLTNVDSLSTLYHEWKDAVTPRIKSKLEMRNLRPVIAPNSREEQEMLVNFAKANPLLHHIILRGLPRTNLADLVFQRLYGKLRVWFRAVGKFRRMAREWVDSVALRMFSNAFTSGRFFLVEKGPTEFGDEDSHAFTAALDTSEERDQPLLAITLGFRKYFMRGSKVYDEESLFQLVLHEMAHMLQTEHPTYEGDDDMLYQAAAHNLSFYRAFIFVYAMAQRAGLVPESRSIDIFSPFGLKPAPRRITKEMLEKIHDAVNFVIMIDAEAIEAEINKNPRGSKRTLEPSHTPDDASYLSDSDFGGLYPSLTRECCLGCGKFGATRTCMGCHVARYCGDKCAAEGWQASHAVACKHFSAFGRRRKFATGDDDDDDHAVELDRSLLPLLPHDVQVMLLEELPASNIFAVIENLSDATKKAALLLLMDRDIFNPMARSEMPRRATIREASRKAFGDLSYPQLLEKYHLVTETVGTALKNLF